MGSPRGLDASWAGCPLTDEAVRNIPTGGRLPAPRPAPGFRSACVSVLACGGPAHCPCPRPAPGFRSAYVSVLAWGALPGTHLATVCLEQSKLLNLTVLDVGSQAGRSHWKDEEAALHLGCKRLQLASFSLSSFLLHEVQEAERATESEQRPPLVAGPRLLPRPPPSSSFREDRLCSLLSWPSPPHLSHLPQRSITVATASAPTPVTVVMPPAWSPCVLSPGLTSPLGTVPRAHNTFRGPVKIL